MVSPEMEKGFGEEMDINRMKLSFFPGSNTLMLANAQAEQKAKLEEKREERIRKSQVWHVLGGMF